MVSEPARISPGTRDSSSAVESLSPSSSTAIRAESISSCGARRCSSTTSPTSASISSRSGAAAMRSSVVTIGLARPMMTSASSLKRRSRSLSDGMPSMRLIT